MSMRLMISRLSHSKCPQYQFVQRTSFLVLYMLRKLNNDFLLIISKPYTFSRYDQTYLSFSRCRFLTGCSTWNFLITMFNQRHLFNVRISVCPSKALFQFVSLLYAIKQGKELSSVACYYIKDESIGHQNKLDLFSQHSNKSEYG